MAETWLIFALMISLCVGSEDNCASYDVNNYESVFKKSKKIERLDEMLRKQDEKRATYFAAPLSGDETGQEIRTKFYRMTSQPLQVSSSKFLFECKTHLLRIRMYQSYVIRVIYVSLQSSGHLLHKYSLERLQ